MLHGVLRDVAMFTGDAVQSDDITAMAVKWVPNAR
jgi:hypothetical protein